MIFLVVIALSSPGLLCYLRIKIFPDLYGCFLLGIKYEKMLSGNRFFYIKGERWSGIIYLLYLLPRVLYIGYFSGKSIFLSWPKPLHL